MAISAFLAVPIGIPGQADALWLGTRLVGGAPQSWEQPFSPGPPLTLHFTYRQGAYQRLK